jgi:uncharacterized membrane protein
MRLWLIPMVYAVGSIMCGFTLPRLEHVYLSSYTLDLSAASVQAYLSAVASGMMVLTGIVFSITFVVVQFSAIVYSPRLVLWFARDPILFHSLGIFVATFTYSLSTLAWVDRGGSGAVPLFSCVLVAIMLMLSVILFSRLVQSINDLQITNVLNMVGNRGRQVIADLFQRLDETREKGGDATRASAEQDRLGPVTQILRYPGEPRAIASINIQSLVRQATQYASFIAMECAVGDTLVHDTTILQVFGAKERLPERQLMRAIRTEFERTFEQDPKYPLRLLVDIAIKALSPAINDPTTAVQAIDQIEDLLIRLGRCDLDAGYARDADGILRLIYPMPKWDDYLTLAFDEIRQYGSGSVQVLRRLRSSLLAVSDSLTKADRVAAVSQYLKHLDLGIDHSQLDSEDKDKARREDRQGLGLARSNIHVR